MTDRALHPFRPRSLQRYQQGRDRAVLPRFVPPPIVGSLWLLLALLTAAAVVAWFARVPAYATGVVVVTELAGDDQQPTLVALVPLEVLPRLRPGRMLLVHLDSGAPIRREVREVEAQPQSPTAVRRRFALDAETTRAVSGPVVVVRLAAVPPRSDPPTAPRADKVYRGEVEVGSCRVLAMAPIVGRLLVGCDPGAFTRESKRSDSREGRAGHR